MTTSSKQAATAMVAAVTLLLLLVEEEKATVGTSPGLPFLAAAAAAGVVAKTANSHYQSSMAINVRRTQHSSFHSYDLTPLRSHTLSFKTKARH